MAWHGNLFVLLQWIVYVKVLYKCGNILKVLDIMLADSQVHTQSSCPSSVHWSIDGLERDLYIQTTTVTVLAMDGRRRWLDIQKLVSLDKVSHPYFLKYFIHLVCF